MAKEKNVFDTRRNEIGSVLAAVILVAAFSFGLWAQKDFNMSEKKQIENFKRANKYYLSGKECLDKGDLKGAESEAEKCLKIMPDSADAYFLLTLVHYKEGSFEEALPMIEKAEANFGLLSKFYSFQYQEYLSRLREQKAEKSSTIIDLKGKLASRNVSAEDKAKLDGQINAINGEINLINSRLSDPIPPNPQVPADYFFAHGNILFRLKRMDEAKSQYLKALEVDPYHANAYNNLINLFFMKGDNAQALDYVQQAEGKGVKLNEALVKAVRDKSK